MSQKRIKKDDSNLDNPEVDCWCMATSCDCNKDCGTMQMVIVNPKIREIVGEGRWAQLTGRTACIAQFPLSEIPSLIKQLLFLHGGGKDA